MMKLIIYNVDDLLFPFYMTSTRIHTARAPTLVGVCLRFVVPRDLTRFKELWSEYIEKIATTRERRKV